MTANVTNASDDDLQTAILARLANRGLTHKKQPLTTSELATALGTTRFCGSPGKAKITATLQLLKNRKLIEVAAPAARARTDRWLVTSQGLVALRKVIPDAETKPWADVRSRIHAEVAKPDRMSLREVSAAELLALLLETATEQLKLPQLRQRLMSGWFGSRHIAPKGPVAFTALVATLGLSGKTALPGRKPEPDPEPEDPAKTSERLLTAVKHALPMIGDDGRFGHEKVFVSAIWRQIASRAPSQVSFDQFKAWLLDANRKRDLDLARADLVSAMDEKLVADSEIRGQGATFHFVLDHSKPYSNGARAVQGRT